MPPYTMTSPPTQINGHVVHVLRPDFVVRLHVGPDETTATLYAYRGDVAVAAGLPRNALNDIVDQHARAPADITDVISGHANRSRGVYVNGSRPVTWFHHKEYDERGAYDL